MIESSPILQASNFLPEWLLNAAPGLNGLGLVHMEVVRDIPGPYSEVLGFRPEDYWPWGTDAFGNFYLGWGPLKSEITMVPDAVVNNNIAWQVPLSTENPDAVWETLAESSGQMAEWMANAGITYNPFGFGATHANSNEAMAGLMDINDISEFIPPVDIWGLGHISEGVMGAVAALDPSFSVAGLVTFGPQIMTMLGNIVPFDFGMIAANDDIGIIEGVRGAIDPMLLAA